MLIIGSKAFKDAKREKNHEYDYDIMMLSHDFDEFINSECQFNNKLHIVMWTTDYCHLKNCCGYENVEIYIGHDNNSTEQLIEYCSAQGQEQIEAPLNVLYAIKMSHRFLRNSPHFIKTYKDIMHMRELGANMDDPVLYKIFELREKETYNYKHPVLDQEKASFFSSDGVNYVYDHDSIHNAIKILDTPAYTHYIKDNADVMTDKDKFFNCSEEIRLLGVYEEACVLALERSQIPNNFEINPKSSFITALIKVCSSITSGYFRLYAWENLYKVIDIYRSYGDDDYIKRFKTNYNLLKPYKETQT